MQMAFRFARPTGLGAVLAAFVAVFSPCKLAAQVIVEPAVLARCESWVGSVDLPAAAAPELEPVVSLSTLVIAMHEADAAGELKLEGDTRDALGEWLAGLTDSLVLPRHEARRHIDELLALLPSRALGVVISYTQRRPYERASEWLGSAAPRFNPFYNPESLPGWAARDLAAKLRATREVTTKTAKL